ncbi:ricin-type beta-trefoil lectin domain protein [Kitasatospora sp. NPDC058115]|uniref:ricin-type beta-trefoil lectin domain protein n=1 Tax=Kitasatospora sp. NPDC058115 TaxID=3346347 RepID=UPI0036D9CF27
MLSIRKAVAVAAATLVAGGTLAAAGPASAGEVRQARVVQNVRFYNEVVNEALDADGSSGPSSNVITWPANGTKYQDWNLISTDRGYLIESVGKPGRCLQSPRNTSSAIVLADCNTAVPTQHWQLDRVGDRTVIAEARDEGLVIQATGSKQSVLAEVANGDPRQAWDVTPS